MTKISAAVVAPILTSVEYNAPNMLEKVRRRLRAIMDEAVEKGVLPGNPLPTPRCRKRSGDRRHYPPPFARRQEPGCTFSKEQSH